MAEINFEKKQAIRWRRMIWRELVKLGFQPQSRLREMNAGLVLLSVANFGTDIATLMELTALPSETIRRVLKRLRQQKILRGQRLRVAGWDEEGFRGTVGILLDVMAAGGEVTRAADPKRSAGQKARAPETYARGLTHSRRPKVIVPEGSVFTPASVQVDPLFTIEGRSKPPR